MDNEKAGFDGATGSKQYFSEKQDGVPVYDVVNLNVRTFPFVNHCCCWLQ